MLTISWALLLDTVKPGRGGCAKEGVLFHGFYLSKGQNGRQGSHTGANTLDDQLEAPSFVPGALGTSQLVWCYGVNDSAMTKEVGLGTTLKTF